MASGFFANRISESENSLYCGVGTSTYEYTTEDDDGRVCDDSLLLD
jgi:hypothetical protein